MSRRPTRRARWLTRHIKALDLHAAARLRPGPVPVVWTEAWHERGRCWEWCQ